jgi:hypothetical protein
VDGTDRTATGRGDRSDRLTVQQAAQRLGVSEEAVRGRIKRGTLESERREGHVYVLVERSVADESGDQQRPVEDRTDPLIAERQDRVRSLEAANRENRRIIATLTQRIPAIEAPESPVPGQTPTEASEAPETGAPRPWWRRMFGG